MNEKNEVLEGLQVCDSMLFLGYKEGLVNDVGPCTTILVIINVSHIFFPVTFSGLEEFNTDKSKCQEHFDVYKECKKKEVLESSALSVP